MLSAVRKVLAFEMTIAEWIGSALLLAAPYVVVGVVWTVVRVDHPSPVSILAWPALLLSTVCTP